mgnify:FL=1
MSSTELFIAIQQNKVRFFQKQEHYIPLTLDGMEEFPYSDFTQDIPGLLERFADKLNLNSPAELSVFVLSGEHPNLARSMVQFINQHTACLNCMEWDIKSILIHIIRDLRSDVSLEIDTFGVNYGSVNYKLVKDTLQTSPYHLLAYTVSTTYLTKYITNSME